MDDRRRQRPEEIEGAARHHQHPGRAAALVERVLERLEPMLGAGCVEGGQARVPGGQHHGAQLLVAASACLVRLRHETEPERRHAGGGHDVHGRVEDDVGDPGRLGGDLRAEEEQLGQQRRGGAPLELLAHVRGVRGRGAEGERVAHPREPLRRVAAPVLDEVVAVIPLAPVRRPRPRHEFGAGCLDVGAEYRVGKDAQTVAARHEGAGDAHQGRGRAAAVPGGHQQLGHQEPPWGDVCSASTSSRTARTVWSRLSALSRRSSFQV